MKRNEIADIFHKLNKKSPVNKKVFQKCFLGLSANFSQKNFIISDF